MMFTKLNCNNIYDKAYILIYVINYHYERIVEKNFRFI